MGSYVHVCCVDVAEQAADQNSAAWAAYYQSYYQNQGGPNQGQPGQPPQQQAPQQPQAPQQQTPQATGNGTGNFIVCLDLCQLLSFGQCWWLHRGSGI